MNLVIVVKANVNFAIDRLCFDRPTFPHTIVIDLNACLLVFTKLCER